MDDFFENDFASAEPVGELPCPYCGCLDNEYVGESYDDNAAYIGSDYKCGDCGATWTDSRWDELHG